MQTVVNNDPYWIMQFDHQRDKSFNISQFGSTTLRLEDIKKEIEKCEVVCANCHANRTHMRLVKSGGDVLDFIMEG